MPHKHTFHSKHSERKRARQELLQELREIPKVYDHEKGECIALEKSQHFEKGEVIYNPKFQSPVLDRPQRGRS